MIRASLVWLGALGLAVSCRSAPPPSIAEVARRPLAAIAPGAPATGAVIAAPVIAAVESGDALFVFRRDRAAIERGGAVAQTVPAPPGGFAEAAVLPALDGAGSWVVARSGAGELWRVTQSGELEPMSERLGLPPRARAIASSGAAFAVVLDDGVAVMRDRHRVERFPLCRGAGVAAGCSTVTALAAPGALAAGTDRIALVSRSGARDGSRGGVESEVEIWRLGDHQRVAYPVPGAFAAAFVARGPGAPADRLIVATPDALYAEAGTALRRIPAPAEIRGIAAAGSQLWISTAHGVDLLDGDQLIATGVAAAAADRLFGIASGDAVLAAQHGAVRLALAGAHDADARWRAEVAPIVLGACQRCHRPGGEAGVDLSTAAAWRADRGALIRRVVEERTMPPAGVVLAPADRAALAGWLLHDH